MRRSAAAAAFAAALIVAPAAAASDATPEQVASLAAKAPSDPASLAALRQVDRIDGRPVDLAASLDTSGAQLRARLRVLAASASVRPAAGSPRGSARKILAERRFRGSGVPRPLHRPLQWLGRELHKLYDSISGGLPGGDTVFWLLVSSIVVAVASFIAARLGRRREGRLLEAGTRATREREEDPARLEHEAGQAERAGDFERALRLRFQAGLLRLVQKRVLPRRESLTNGEIDRRLGSQSFRGLAKDFDEVIYGRRTASAEHLDRARQSWPRVPEEARS